MIMMILKHGLDNLYQNSNWRTTIYLYKQMRDLKQKHPKEHNKFDAKDKH